MGVRGGVRVASLLGASVAGKEDWVATTRFSCGGDRCGMSLQPGWPGLILMSWLSGSSRSWTVGGQACESSRV